MKNTLKTQWGDKEQRRQDILQAARLLLESEGYQGLNIRQVATQASVSPGLVYAYFANKEELFATLYVERLILLQQQVESECSQAKSFHEFFVLLLTAYLPVYRHFGREFNLFSLLRQPQQFPALLTEQLSATALQLIQHIYRQSLQFLANEEIQMTDIPDHTLILPMFWITLNGLADHFTGDRQHLYGHSLHAMSSFFAQTLLLGLKQHAVHAATPSAPE